MVVKNIVGTAEFRAEKMVKTDLVAGGQLFTGLNCFEPGQEHALHTHAGQDKIYLVLEGNGVVTVGEKIDTVESGDLVFAKSAEPHALRNPGPGRLVVMAVMAPPPSPK